MQPGEIRVIKVYLISEISEVMNLRDN